ncbi:MAG TPA: tetratricopeptide repeat protein [Dehalococcoidales bacterium]|nr:tetratricopeptide repeat protein [Dehalococcoidales bacterium]
MATPVQPENDVSYQIKVTLKGSKPPIWRRLQVPGDISLHNLHLTVQVAMGWTNSHLYRFDIEGEQYGEPHPKDKLHGLARRNSRTTKLSRVVPMGKSKFIYEYDFGDGWEHQIVVEKILPAQAGVSYLVCMTGRRACPPEDCGGVWGYARLLELFSDPTHEEYDEMREWLGGDFNPEEFDLEGTNDALKYLAEDDVASKSKVKIGRNDPCPCDSGKKYKKCCGATSKPISLPDRRLMERNLLSIQKLMANQNFQSADEMNAYLKQFSGVGRIPQLNPETPLEEAQELIYQALESTEKKERIHLAMESLKVCDNCADAYVLLAEEAAETIEQARDWYRRGMDAGERALGPEVFTKEAGNFWGIIETRPYMRAREGLADCLYSLGEHDAAMEHYRDILRLNPNDNQGVRYKLLICLMETNDINAAKELLGQYPDEYSADWFFTRALIAFIQHGTGQESNKQLRQAMQYNPHVVPYLLGQRRLPRALPNRIGFGDEDEAASYVAEFADVWLGIPGVLEWVKAVTRGKR